MAVFFGTSSVPRVVFSHVQVGMIYLLQRFTPACLAERMETHAFGVRDTFMDLPLHTG